MKFLTFLTALIFVQFNLFASDTVIPFGGIVTCENEQDAALVKEAYVLAPISANVIDNNIKLTVKASFLTCKKTDDTFNFQTVGPFKSFNTYIPADVDMVKVITNKPIDVKLSVGTEAALFERVNLIGEAEQLIEFTIPKEMILNGSQLEKLAKGEAVTFKVHFNLFKQYEVTDNFTGDVFTTGLKSNIASTIVGTFSL